MIYSIKKNKDKKKFMILRVYSIIKRTKNILLTWFCNQSFWLINFYYWQTFDVINEFLCKLNINRGIDFPGEY